MLILRGCVGCVGKGAGTSIGSVTVEGGAATSLTVVAWTFDITLVIMASGAVTGGGASPFIYLAFRLPFAPLDFVEETEVVVETEVDGGGTCISGRGEGAFDPEAEADMDMLRAGSVIESECDGGGTEIMNGRAGADVGMNGSRISFSLTSRNRMASVRPIGCGIVSVGVASKDANIQAAHMIIVPSRNRSSGCCLTAEAAGCDELQCRYSGNSRI
jgi:hypothetical protein